MKKAQAISHLIRVGEDIPICIAIKEEDAKWGANTINALLQEAYDKGREDELSEPWRESPFDDEEAPLIDVPEGSDEPDYGPEKIPPRYATKH